MNVEFLVFGYLAIMALAAVFSVYSLMVEWLPNYLRRRKATAADRATEWVNAHPIQTKGRKMR